MKSSQLAWALLLNSVGNYQGRGVNHEQQNYTGNLKLDSAFPNKMLSLVSTATGDTGEVYHQEVSWIGFDITGALVLYVTSNNHPAITPHIFNRIEEKENVKNIVFRFGNLEDEQSFREEVTLSFYRDGSVAHHYAWGLPGGEFQARSGSQMHKC